MKEELAVSTQSDMPTTEELTFVGGAGAKLSGVLHHPAAQTPVLGSVLIAHCFSCGKDIRTTLRLAKALADAGYAVLRFDFTGLGESGGAFESTSVSSNVSDLTRAATTLIERGYGPCVLIGHSLGGAAALLAAHRLKTVSSIITLAAPSAVDHVRHLFTHKVDEIARQGKAEVSLGGRPFCLGTGFLDDLNNHDVLEAAASIGRPYLVVIAGNDTVVEPANGHALADAAGSHATKVVIDGADHMFSNRAHADELADRVLEFLAEH